MSSNTPEPDAAPSAAGDAVDAALAQISAGVDGFTDVGLVGLSPGELLRLIARVHTLVDRVDGLALAVVAEADTREVCQAAGAATTKAWLVHTCRIRPSVAGRRVRLARALHGSSSGHAGVRDAVTAGLVSLDHAEVIRACVAGFPDEVPPAMVDDAHTVLLGHARTMDPARLGAAAKHLGTVLDPDGAAAFAREEHRLRTRSGLHATDTGHGYVRLTGSATTEQWAWLATGIDPLTAPQPGPGGEPDPRSLPERRLHALIELVRTALATPDIGDHGGSRPQLIVTVPYTTLQADPHLTTTDHLPHLDLDLDTNTHGGTLSPEAARRLACDAHLIPAVLGTRSEPLDLGRATYTVPTALRRAVTLRDHHCRFPGCHRRPRNCHVHHIHHWADGGTTDLPNLCLLCDYHHHLIHQPNSWTITKTPQGPTFTPPPWIRGP